MLDTTCPSLASTHEGKRVIVRALLTFPLSTTFFQMPEINDVDLDREPRMRRWDLDSVGVPRPKIEPAADQEWWQANSNGHVLKGLVVKVST